MSSSGIYSCRPSLRQHYADRAQGDSIAGRLSDAFALLDLTGELAAKALEMSALQESAVAPLWQVLTIEASEGDRATEALRFAWDYACARADEFFGRRDGFGRHEGRSDQPPRGWLGQWSRHSTGSDGWKFLGYIPDRLKEILQGASFEYDAVVSTWKDRAWLLIDPSDKSGKHRQVLINGERPRVIAIKREALEQAGCAHDQEPDELRDLRDAAQTFLTKVQDGPEPYGDSQTLADAIRAVQAWHSTLVVPQHAREPTREPDTIEATSLGERG